MRCQHLGASIALALLSATSTAQQAAQAPTEGLARFRDALAHIQERDASAKYAVPDEEVARIAKEIEQVLHVPGTWHVMLRNLSKYGAEMNRIPTRFNAHLEMISTTLKDHADREIELSVTLDAQSVSIGNALFVGPDGKTDFTVRQFRERIGFFPLRAIPIVLDRLESELDALPVEKSNVKYVGLESPQPLGESPYVRCVLSFEDNATSKPVMTGLNGIIALPAAAAHERGFQFGGTRGTGDSVIGPVTSVRSLDRCFRESRALSDAVSAGGDWAAHVFHNNGRDTFPTLVHDLRNPREKEYGVDLRIESSGFFGETEEISASIAGVPLTGSGVRAFLTSLAAAYDPKAADIFVIIGCAERHEIDVVFTTASSPPPYKHDADSIQLVFDKDGSKIEQQDRVIVSGISKRNEDPHIHWTCRFADDRTAHIWIRRSEMCGVGVDFTSRCRVGDTPYGVAGGVLESTLRDG
jgi:hypothetical protein